MKRLMTSATLMLAAVVALTGCVSAEDRANEPGTSQANPNPVIADSSLVVEFVRLDDGRILECFRNDADRKWSIPGGLDCNWNYEPDENIGIVYTMEETDSSTEEYSSRYSVEYLEYKGQTIECLRYFEDSLSCNW